MSTAKTPKTLTVDQQHQLLESLLRKGAPTKTAKKGIRNYLIGCLMLDAGLRVGEVVALKLSHLFFDKRPVDHLFLTPDVTKNNKLRTVPVTTRLKSALEEFYKYNTWLHQRPDDYSIWGTEHRDTPITTRQVENIFFSAGMRSFGRPINPHMLRHTFASRLLRVTNMRTVQELLGHNYITSTQIYTHPNEDDKKEAIDKIDENGSSV